MKDPTRLLNLASSDAELRLLRAGVLDEPPAEAMQRLAAALGLPAATPPAVECSSAAATATGAPEAVGSSTASAFAGSASVTAKWSLLALSGLAALAAGTWLAARSVPERGAPQPAERAVTAPARSAPPPALAPASAGERPLQPSAAVATAAAPVAASRDPGLAPALAEEIARLDVVRRLLASRQARAALVELARYAREYPAGALRPEATVLRIEALQRAGERARARALAAGFLSDHPASPHAARVRALQRNAQ